MTKPDFRSHFLEGIDHFNSRRFWEAHEAWETLWLEAESDLDQYLQGLIQIAAAYHHIQRGTTTASGSSASSRSRSSAAGSIVLKSMPQRAGIGNGWKAGRRALSMRVNIPG